MKSAPWRRTAGLAAPLLSGWRSSIAEHQGGEARVLAWTDAEEQVCIGSAGVLSIGAGEDWVHVGWHAIERGGWDAETGVLQWRSYDGTRTELRLTPPRRVPDLFRERVAASIVVEQVVPFPGSRGIICSGRRDLRGVDRPISWHATPTRGLDWSVPGATEAAEDAVQALRYEYDIGGECDIP